MTKNVQRTNEDDLSFTGIELHSFVKFFPSIHIITNFEKQKLKDFNNTPQSPQFVCVQFSQFSFCSVYLKYIQTYPNKFETVQYHHDNIFLKENFTKVNCIYLDVF